MVARLVSTSDSEQTLVPAPVRSVSVTFDAVQSSFHLHKQVCSQQRVVRSWTMATVPLAMAPKGIRTTGASSDVGFETAARVNRYRKK